MRLNHLDLQVPNVLSTAEFFERHFGFQVVSNRASPAIIILSGEGSFTLVLQRRRCDNESYPEGFHVGFIVDDEERVRDKHQQIRDYGIACSDIITNNRGTMFYLSAPGGITVEVSCRSRRSA
jgi:catechol 2,3-dioxygenase-like lactoylglutathione lyase family enzyme